MDAQDLVLDRFPDAETRQEPAIYKHGENAPIQDGHWAVIAGPGFDAEELGRGRSEAGAWADAAGQLVRLAA